MIDIIFILKTEEEIFFVGIFLFHTTRVVVEETIKEKTVVGEALFLTIDGITCFDSV